MNDNYNGYIPEVGDLFEWNEHYFWCIQTGRHIGTVNPVGESYYLSSFRWLYDGCFPKFIRKSTKEEQDKQDMVLPVNSLFSSPRVAQDETLRLLKVLSNALKSRISVNANAEEERVLKEVAAFINHHQ